MELLAPPPHSGYELSGLEHGEVLGDRLAGHVHVRAKLAQRLTVAGVEAVQQPPAAGIGQRPEHVVDFRWIGSHKAA